MTTRLDSSPVIFRHNPADTEFNIAALKREVQTIENGLAASLGTPP